MEDKVCDGKNAKSVVCKQCSSVVLRPSAASFVKKDEGLYLPHMKKVKKQENQGDSSDAEGEKYTDFWSVTHMYAFENVGFCNTVDNIKYLACADCEAGPIGAHFLNTTEFYVALDRTKEG